jgi:hypothetical protein
MRTIALPLACAISAAAGAGAGEPASRPGGLVYAGLGATAIAAVSPGIGGSYELALEPGRGLVQF